MAYRRSYRRPSYRRRTYRRARYAGRRYTTRRVRGIARAAVRSAEPKFWLEGQLNDADATKTSMPDNGRFPIRVPILQYQTTSDFVGPDVVNTQTTPTTAEETYKSARLYSMELFAWFNFEALSSTVQPYHISMGFSKISENLTGEDITIPWMDLNRQDDSRLFGVKNAIIMPDNQGETSTKRIFRWKWNPRRMRFRDGDRLILTGAIYNRGRDPGIGNPSNAKFTWGLYGKCLVSNTPGVTFLVPNSALSGTGFAGTSPTGGTGANSNEDWTGDLIHADGDDD